MLLEDDGQDNHDADEVRGGPNRALSLTGARNDFARFAASEKQRVSHVRPAATEEM
ncbi:MAG: CPCC family cysteine-rich protein [Terriglobales bacterium]